MAKIYIKPCLSAELTLLVVVVVDLGNICLFWFPFVVSDLSGATTTTGACGLLFALIKWSNGAGGFVVGDELSAERGTDDALKLLPSSLFLIVVGVNLWLLLLDSVISFAFVVCCVVLVAKSKKFYKFSNQFENLFKKK